MNRKEFFKKLGFGTLAAAIVPKVLAKEEESHLFTYSRDNGHALSYKDAQLIADENLKVRMQYPLTPQECYNSYNNGFEFWHDLQSYNTGVLKIIRNGFYTYNDLFSCNGKRYIINKIDEHFYYAYPI